MVEDFPERIDKLNDELWYRMQGEYGAKNISTDDILWPRGKYAQALMNQIKWLGKESTRHASIDTYAKKLFIRNDKEAIDLLHLLKATLSCYILIEQSLREADKRYDSFFASLLRNEPGQLPSLPKEVNIVTWNYDTQLEKSYREFCQDPSFVYEGITRKRNIIRLNGACGVPFDESKQEKNLCYEHFSLSFLESVLKLYDNLLRKAEGYRPYISFAWERREPDTRILETIKGTTTLVIIGYSLPYFNRDIDKIIFETMAPSLEKIFIQAPAADHPALEERFLTCFADQSVKQTISSAIEMIEGTDLFYIPDNMPR
jgi:hypothetical protein